MSSPPYPLTPEVQKSICAYIAAGGFPHVAAEAAGVPRHVFDDWMRRGERKGARPAYKAFARAVRQAEAQARLAAEVKALAGKPLDWLKSGPGSVGWAAGKRPATAEAPPVELLLIPWLQKFITGLLELLTPYPEVRAAAARLADSLPALPAQPSGNDAPPPR